MRPGKIICTLLSFAVSLSALSGCGSSRTEAESELNIGISSPPLTMDAQMITDEVSSTVISFFTSTLFMYDVNNVLQPCLAESMEMSEDGLTATFRLKEGLKWSNGEELTSDDFVYSFKRIADPETGSNAVYLITDCCSVKNANKIVLGEMPVSELGVSAPDNRTFVVELETPCPYLSGLLTYPAFSPCNRSFCNDCGEKYAKSPETIVSCGAYIPDRYEPLGSQIHMRKNPDYVFADCSSAPGISFQVVSDTQQAFMCYVNGMLDVIKISGEVYELSKDDPCLRYFQSVSTYFFDMNFRDVPALQNRNIRMALAKSIDRESITKNIMGSGYFPLERVNPPGYYSEEDGSDFSGDRHRYDEYMHYDTARALELWRKGLEEVGITSLTIEFSYLSSLGKVAEAIKSQMESALPGLELKLKTMQVKEYNTKILTGTGYEMMIVGWGADFADPAAFLSLYYKCEGVKYTNDEFDRIFAESGTAEAINTPGRRNELLHKAEDILMEDVAQIPFYTLARAYLVRDTVKNFDLKPTGLIDPTGLDKEGT